MTPTNILEYILTMLLFLFLTIALIHGAVLAYHWFQFGTDKKTSMSALCVYTIGMLILLGLLAGCVIF